MTKAVTPSPEELQAVLDSAVQVVDFSYVSGSETPNIAEISLHPHETVVVRLSCAGGYRGVLVSGQSGLLSLSEVPEGCLSSEEALALVENLPELPEGVSAKPVVPFASSQGAGLVGAPVPFLSVLKFDKPGDFTFVYSILRVWAPASAPRYALKVHVNE